MAQQDFLTRNHVVPVHGYSADLSAATQDVFNLAEYRRITIFIMAGGANADTSTFTVNANTALSTSGGVAMPFKYRTLAAGANPASADAWSALTAATAAGVALTATTFKCWAIEVTAEDLQAANPGAQYVYLAFADAGGALTGSMFAILSEPRNAGSVPVTAIA